MIDNLFLLLSYRKGELSDTVGRNASFPEPSAVDLQCIANRIWASMCSSGMGSHIFDVNYVTAVIDKCDTQGNESVFHPEGQVSRLFVDE